MTPRQRETLSTIVAFISEWGWPPTLKELGEALSVHWSVAAKYVEALHDAGLIMREPAVNRGIALTVRGWNALGMDVPSCMPRLGAGPVTAPS